MGNRAIITNKDRQMGVYVHWNGGRDSIEPLLKYCEMQGFRSPDTDPQYGWARITQVLTNFFPDGLSVGVVRYSDDKSMNPGDNGIYIIEGWEIVDRVYPYECFREQREYDMFEMMCAFDSKMPACMQKGSAAIAEYLGVENVPDELTQRKIKAVKAFLGQKGIKVFGSYRNGELVADALFYDDDVLVFGFLVDNPQDAPNRREFEEMIVAYLTENHETTEPTTQVRADFFTLHVVSNDKALMKHHVNALSR